MKIRKIICLALTIVLGISLLCGCGHTSYTESGAEIPRKVKDNGKPLTVYCSDPSSELMVNTYNSSVEEKNRLTIYETNQEDMGQQIGVDLLSGQGPDIFLLSLTNFINQYSALSKGLFQDLNYYFEKDPVDWSQYRSEVMDSGVFEGKRMVLPINYMPYLYAGKKNEMERYQIPQDLVVADDRISELLSFGQKAADDNLGLFSSVEPYKILTDFLDYENKTANFDSEEFRETAKQYKEIDYLTNPSDFIFYELYGQSTPAGVVSALMDTEMGELVLVPHKYRQEDSGIKADVYRSVAINVNSPNGERAFQFVKWLLSERVQNDKTLVAGIPVYNPALQAQIDENTGFSQKQKDYMEQYEKLLENIVVIENVDWQFYSEIFVTLWEQYLTDTIDINELSQQLQKKAELYLKEM